MAFYDPITKIYHGVEVPQIYHPNASLGQVLLWNFYKHPYKVIQVSDDDGISVKCAEMGEMMTNIAKNLKNLGLSFGDAAGLFATNSTYVAPTMFACYLIGLPMTPLDVSFNANQIAQIYSQTKPKIVFCDHTVVEKLISALEILESEARIVILTERLQGFLHITDLITPPDEPVQLNLNLGSSEDVVAAILCTSGSSGMPKLARVSHAHYLQQFSLNQFYEETFSLNFSSLYWLTGISNIIYQALNVHKRLITSRPFSPELCCDLIEKYPLKHLFLLPPHVCLLMGYPRFHTTDFSSLNLFTSGGMPLSEQMRKLFKQSIPNTKFCFGFGMTEVGGIVSETSPEDPLTSSVGKPSPNTQIKILIDDGSIGGFFEIGEILVKKPMKFLGYIGDRHPNIMDNYGWVHTGDMGYIDDKLNIYLVGQRSFVIKNFYNEIYPNEIEDSIQRVVDVQHVCVIGIPDPVEIEVPAVFVVKLETGNVTEDEIIAATNHLPPFKRIRKVFFVDSLPTTPSGKIQRRVVKEIAEEMKISAMSKKVGIKFK